MVSLRSEGLKTIMNQNESSGSNNKWLVLLLSESLFPVILSRLYHSVKLGSFQSPFLSFLIFSAFFISFVKRSLGRTFCPTSPMLIYLISKSSQDSSLFLIELKIEKSDSVPFLDPSCSLKHSKENIEYTFSVWRFRWSGRSAQGGACTARSLFGWGICICRDVFWTFRVKLGGSRRRDTLALLYSS